MTPKSSQTNWHLIHHNHITKLFYLLNQNTIFIIDNKILTSKLYIVSITKNLSIHHILYSEQYNNSHKINSSPLISNHIILEQNTTKGNKLRQHYSLVNTVFYVFSPQTPSLVVQSTVRLFPQVTPLFHKIISASNSIIPQNNTTRFATKLQDKGIFNLESEYHSQHNSHG